MKEEDDSAQDSVDQGEEGVEVEILLILRHCPKDVGCQHHGQDEDQGPLHDLCGQTLLLVHLLCERERRFRACTHYVLKSDSSCVLIMTILRRLVVRSCLRIRRPLRWRKSG